MARAAVAAGADGIIVEVHPNPEQALSDGAQTLFPDQFAQLMREIRVIAEVIGRRVAEPARSEEHTSELQSPCNLVCRLLLEKKKRQITPRPPGRTPDSRD